MIRILSFVSVLMLRGVHPYGFGFVGHEIHRRTGYGQPSRRGSWREIDESSYRISGSCLSTKEDVVDHVFDAKDQTSVREAELLQLSNAKLQILEGVVKEVTARMNEQKAEWKERYSTITTANNEARERLRDLQRSWDESKQDWRDEANRYERKVTELRNEVERLQFQITDDNRKYQELEARLRKKVDVLKGDLKKMDEEMIAMERRLSDVTDELTRNQGQSMQALDRERERVATLEEDLFLSNKERSDALALLNDLKRVRETDAEAVEIAQAAVAAAERREAKIRANYEILSTENYGLQQQLVERDIRMKSLEAEKGKLEEQDRLSSGRSSEAETILRSEVKNLEDQIAYMRMAHESRLREERLMSENQASKLEAKYYRQMQDFRKASLGMASSRTKRGFWKRIRGFVGGKGDS